MENFKKILAPIGLIALIVAVFSFTNHKEGDEDQCTIKIIKIIDGVETEIDSTFDCSDEMTWINAFHHGEEGESLHKMIKIMMTDGDSSDFVFDFDFDESHADGMKIMKIKGGEKDGEEVEMKFDFKSNGDGKIMINGEEIEVKMDALHKHLEKMHEKMEFIHDETGNIELIIEGDEDGDESKTIKIMKTLDDDGNVSVKKWVNGEEVEFDEKAMHEGQNMIFIGEDGEVSGEHEMKIEVKVDGKEGEEAKHIVIISNMTSSSKKEIEKTAPKVASNLSKKELKMSRLKFSPNPNNGKFDLQFKLDQKEPVTITVYDLQGKEVYNETLTNFSGKYAKNIDISENGKGTYILQIMQNNKAKTSKIVIK